MREQFEAARMLLTDPRFSEETIRMIKADLSPAFEQAARLFNPKCVHCGALADEHGYAHADRCPIRVRDDR